MDLSRLSAADRKAFEENNPDGMSVEGLRIALGEDASPKRKSSTLDAPNAFATGFLRGATRLGTSPVDAMANVLDLGKAALGTPFLLAGKEPPKMLQLSDRADVPGSGANVLRAFGNNKLTSAMVNPANPDYEGGYAQALGGGLAGATTPGQAAVAASGTLAGKALYDKLYDPNGDPLKNAGATAASITASMLPAGGPTLASQATKRAIRGDETGRVEMLRRMAVLRDAGVDRPTLGLASGNGVLGGVETVLQTVPGSMGIFQRSRDRASTGMQNATTFAADLAALDRGRTAAGSAVQRDLKDFHQRRVAPGYLRSNSLAEGAIGSDTPVTVHNAIGRAEQLSTPHPGAPETSGSMIQPRIAEWRRTLTSDAGGAPARMDAAGMYYPAIPQTGVPYRVLKNLRTSIGDEAASLDNVGRPIQGQIRSMYGALSEDMKNAALMSDLKSGPSNRLTLPTSASGALTRANALYSGGMKREERTAALANAKEVEPMFDALARMPAKSPGLFNAVKKSVNPTTRGSVAATVIDELGTATSGSQNHTGDVFSPATFLTNWDKLTPAGREALFSGFPNATQAHAQVSAIAEAANMMRDNSRHWANPSGTAANTSNRKIITGLGLGLPAAMAGLGSWGVPTAAAAAMAGSNMLSKRMTDPRVVDWAASRTPQLSRADIGALSRMMNASERPSKTKKDD